uniref:Uncharacterized protein n=1 Tax=Arundo donax TaxID=35708 RepID=A0A0A9BZZ7_ARUDO
MFCCLDSKRLFSCHPIFCSRSSALFIHKLTVNMGSLQLFL